MTTYDTKGMPNFATTDLIAASGDGLREDLNLISASASSAIGAEGSRAESAAKSYADTIRYQRPDLTAASDYNNVVATGDYKQLALLTDALAQHAPVSGFRGDLRVLSLTSGATIQWATTWATNKPRVYVRAQSSGAWGAWFEVGADIYEVNILGLTATQDFNLLDVAGTQRKTWTLAAVPTDWVAQHMPVNVRGSVTMTPIGSSRLMEYMTWEATPRLFTRWKSGGAWGAWSQIGAPAPAPPAPVSKAASGMKVVGVPLTAGHFGSEGDLEQAVRMPLRYEASARRFRVGFQHVNPRPGTYRASAITVTNICYGDHAGLGVFGAGKTNLGGVTVPADGTAVYTKWANITDWSGLDKLLGFGYTAAAAPWAMLGHAYKTATAADATVDAPAGLVKTGLIPCTVWLEVETYNTTPVVASFGDSNSVGVGASNGLHDSWLSQFCRRVKAFPVHLGSSGDSCNLSLDGAGYKYTRFAALTRPDAVFMAMGQNDAAETDITSAAIKPKIDTVLANLKSSVSDNVYAVNYMPRTSSPWAGFETVRRELSAYLETEPGTVRDVFDFASAMSTDDETITPAYDSGDGTHLNADGFGVVQAAISRPVTTPPVQYVAL